jgi:DNA-binding winged helix-turn-helix (wHTH) protein
MYVTVNDVPAYWPVVRELGFRPLASGPVAVDGVQFTTVVLDFGEHSVDGWLVDLLARELGVADEPTVDADAGSLTIGGVPVALTPLEFGLFEHLRQREGRTVTRRELLRDVWETPFAASSNVVDAVVHTLRGKLGPAASAVESVRGRGYRLREDWRVRL